MVAKSKQAAERLPSLLSLPQRQHAAETAYRKGATTESEQKNPVTRFIVFDERRVTVLDILRDSEARCPAGQIVGPRDKPIAPGSPWQNGFAERLIGSIRRECVDHIVVLGEMHLRRVLKSYARYYSSGIQILVCWSRLANSLVVADHKHIRAVEFDSII